MVAFDTASRWVNKIKMQEQEKSGLRRSGEQISIPLTTVGVSNMETGGKKSLLYKPYGSSFDAHTLFLQIN